MKRFLFSLAFVPLLLGSTPALAQDSATLVQDAAVAATSTTTDSTDATTADMAAPLGADTTGMASIEDMIGQDDMSELQMMAGGGGLHEQLKTKFVEGSA